LRQTRHPEDGVERQVISNSDIPAEGTLDKKHSRVIPTHFPGAARAPRVAPEGAAAIAERIALATNAIRQAVADSIMEYAAMVKG